MRTSSTAVTPPPVGAEPVLDSQYLRNRPAFRRLQVGRLSHLRQLSLIIPLHCRALRKDEPKLWGVADHVAAAVLAADAVGGLHNLQDLSLVFTLGASLDLAGAALTWQVPVALAQLTALQLCGVKLGSEQIDATPDVRVRMLDRFAFHAGRLSGVSRGECCGAPR